MRRIVFSVLSLSLLALPLPAPAMECDVCDPEWQVIEDGFEMLPSAPAVPDPLPPDPPAQVIEGPIEHPTEVILEDMRPAAEPSPATSTTAPPPVDDPAEVVRIVHRRPAFGPATRIPI